MTPSAKKRFCSVSSIQFTSVKLYVSEKFKLKEERAIILKKISPQHSAGETKLLKCIEVKQIKFLRKLRLLAFLFAAVAIVIGFSTLNSPYSADTQNCCWVLYCTTDPPIVCWEECRKCPSFDSRKKFSQ